MSEIVHAGGGQHTGGKKGKMSKNQKMLFFGGGLAVIGFFLVMSRGKSSSSSSEQEEIPDYLTNYPTLGPQNALMNDQMNTLIGQQEEMWNSVLEMTGKKPPDTVSQLQLLYDKESDAIANQGRLAKLGMDSSKVFKVHMNGWNGEKDYYAVHAYASDKDKASEIATEGKEKGYWNSVSIQTVKSKDSLQKGTHTIDWK